MVNLNEYRNSIEKLPNLRSIKFNNFNFVLRDIPANRLNNQRYTAFSFLPIILFD